MNSAIITGSTSFIGSALIKTLLLRGIECYAIVRRESKNIGVLPKSSKLHIVFEDVKNIGEWIKKLPACDVFYHFAWDGVGALGRANKEIQKSNVKMALDCLKAAAKLGCKRFVFSGSQAEYGEFDEAITEDMPCNPIIEYGKAKLDFFYKASALSKQMNIEYVHLRIFSVYGPGDHPWTLVSQCISSFINNQTVPLSSCEQMWNYLYIDDAAEAIYQMGICTIDSEVFNIGGEDSRPLKSFVEEIHNACGGKGNPGYGERKSAKEKAIGINPVVDKMKKATGWSQKMPFGKGIEITVSKAKEKKV